MHVQHAPPSLRSGLLSSMRLTQETIFYCRTLIMIYSFRTGDRCTTQAVSQQEEKVVEAETERALTSCGVYWPFLTVPLSSTLIWTGRKRGTDYCSAYLKSCFGEEKPIIGTNSCFHHGLKGRKLLNKEDITGLKRGHCGVTKLSLVGLRVL